MPLKTCSKCKEQYPATTEYFNKEPRIKSGLRSTCRECSKKYHKQHDKNRYFTEQQKINRAIYIHDRIVNNHDMFKERWKAYREINRDKIALTKQEYYINNKEHIKQIGLQYRASNEDYRHKNSMRKQLRRDLTKGSAYTLKQWTECKNYFNNRCAYCGREEPLHKDHVMPFIRGGEFSINNIVPSCQRCNSSKHDKNVFEWYVLQKYYSKKRESIIAKYLEYDKTKKVQQLALIK